MLEVNYLPETQKQRRVGIEINDPIENGFIGFEKVALKWRELDKTGEVFCETCVTQSIEEEKFTKNKKDYETMRIRKDVPVIKTDKRTGEEILIGYFRECECLINPKHKKSVSIKKDEYKKLDEIQIKKQLEKKNVFEKLNEEGYKKLGDNIWAKAGEEANYFKGFVFCSKCGRKTEFNRKLAPKSKFEFTCPSSYCNTKNMLKIEGTEVIIK